MITAGVDIGSLTGKALLLKDKTMLSWSIVPTSYDSAETANNAIGEALNKARLLLKQVDYVVATGYGRVVVPFANKNISEISCHAQGACFLNPNVRTILDMGGQDCKAIRCDASGNVTGFAMNDKCAAGAGRYLEIMAELLGVSLSEIGELSLMENDNPIAISSTCTVFARSEILRHLREGASRNAVLSAAHEALSTRILGLLKKVGIEKELMFTGGVAKNVGIVRRIERQTGLEVKTVFEPQIIGALGAALFGQKAAARV